MPLGPSMIGYTLLGVTIFLVIAWPEWYRGRAKGRVQVVVLGDVGRSPRMQYHALSVAQHSPVDLIGYYESDLVEELAKHPRLTKVPLSPPPATLRRLPFIVGGPLKVIWQILNLAIVLGYGTRAARWIIVQNPPSIPTLAVTAAIAAMRNSGLLVDWHNYGWSILAGTRGADHPFVKISKLYEAFFGRFGTANLAVTEAMARQLRAWPYDVAEPLAVLHDRPAALFQPPPLPFPPPGPDRGREIARILADGGSTAATQDSAVDIEALVAKRGARVLMSSTSWTPDEDFQLLLDGLVEYAKKVASSSTVPTSGTKDDVTFTRPPVLAVITGKGPQKALYEEKIAQLAADGKLDDIVIHTAFLPMSDYAKLLSLADLGVCLHMSSSGVDLPMKVVDMFGAGLPVVAYSDYESFGELVREGVNGRGFVTATELAWQLAELFDDSKRSTGSSKEPSELDVLRQGARAESKLRWAEEWERVVAPILGFNKTSASLQKPAEAKKDA